MRKTISILFALALVLSFSLVATTSVAAATREVGPGKTYATIQAAVNAANAGDTILVYPGVYGEHQFTSPVPPHWGSHDQYAPALIVWKDNLTIRAVDPSPGATVIQTTYDFWVNKDLGGGGGGGSIEHSTGCTWNAVTKVWEGSCVRPMSGTPPNAVAIIAGGVTLDGFTIRRPVPTDGSKGPGYNAVSVMIGGLYAGYGGAGETLGYNNNTIKNCTFRDTWKGVYIWRSSGNTIENNTIEALGNTGHWAGISVYDGGTVVPPPTSQNNIIRGNSLADKGIAVGAWPGQTDNSGTVIQGNTCTEIGITFSSSANMQVKNNTVGPGRIWTSGGSATILLANLSVLGNTVGAGAGNGMQIFWVSGGTFSGNTVTGRGANGIALLDAGNVLIEKNNVTDNGASGIVLVRTNNVAVDHNTILRNTGNVDNPGGLTIREGVSGTTATCNTIVSNSIGIWIRDTAGTNNEAHFNDIHGSTAFGVQNNHASVFDATDNWWGHDSGPDGIGDKVSGSVLYDPWIKKAVATTATGTGPVLFSPSVGNILDLTPVAAPSLPSVTFPHGMFSFQICCLTPGQTVDLTVTLPSNVPVGTVWWKYDNGRWYSLPNLDDNGDNKMRIRLTDGGVGDSDGVADGFITDPGGPGNPMTVGWDGSPVSRAGVLAPWIALLAAIVAGAGLSVWKRRRVEI